MRAGTIVRFTLIHYLKTRVKPLKEDKTMIMWKIILSSMEQHFVTDLYEVGVL